jgi:hypothetical protein
LCAKADLILLVNKKINFISPTSGPGNNTLGSTLVAYGERGVQALMHAAAAGLGTLFKPYQPALTSGDAESETQHVENYSESETENVVPFLRQPQGRTPPDHYKQLETEFNPFVFDATPDPSPQDGETQVRRDEPEARYTHYDDPYHSIGGGVRICKSPQTKRFIANVEVPLDFDLAAHLRAVFDPETDR